MVRKLLSQRLATSIVNFDMNKKPVVYLFLFFCFFVSLNAQNSKPDRVYALIEKALVSGSQDAVVSALVTLSVSEKLITDKKRVLVSLASFEERSGLLLPAAKHFNEAAWINSSKRDDSLVLDAARCALSANDTEQADSLVRSVLLSSFDDALLVRARVMAAWIQLAIGSRRDALELIRSYAVNPAFSEWAPSLLFTLYWTENDTSARDTLLASWPETPEAGITRGEISLATVPFWYLMDRNEKIIATFNHSVIPVNTREETTEVQKATPVEQTHTSTGLFWQQVGFFKSKEYALELSGKLSSLGFKPVIRSELRPSGTLYHAVLVPEDEKHSTAAHLKNAGFESYLVID